MIDLKFNKEIAKALKALRNIIVKDELRPSLSYVAFRGGYLYAIGEKALSLIRIPLEFYGFSNDDIELLEGNYLHIDELLELAACDVIEVRENELLGKRGTRKILCDFTVLNDYPAVETVFPERISSEGKITFNVTTLNSLVSAFVETRRIVGSDCYSNGVNSPVLVVPFYGDATFGADGDAGRDQEAVIVPIRKTA